MEHFKDLKETKIFKDATEFECQAMMFCFKARFKNFIKGEKIVKQGDPMEEAVLIVKGGSIVEHIDTLGNISILMRLKKGDIYGVESSYAGDKVYKDSVIASEKTLVLFMNKHRLITPCENRCRKHESIIKNLTQIIAENNLSLLEKLSHMSKKTMREKLLSYFNSLARKSGSNYFDIPFSKTELANYLSVDRSAMSSELTKMKEDGLIDFEKRQFHLLKSTAKKSD